LISVERTLNFFGPSSIVQISTSQPKKRQGMTKSMANHEKEKTFDPWEILRAKAWVYEVLRLAQIKMETNLASADPFLIIKSQIRTKWRANQTHKVNRKIVTIYDLDKFLWGRRSARTDFAKFENGERVRLHSATLNTIDNLLPGSKIFFEVGPNGVPLWAALRGEITPTDFWEPLVSSGQVTDTLELFLEDTEWQMDYKAYRERKHPRPMLIATWLPAIKSVPKGKNRVIGRPVKAVKFGIDPRPTLVSARVGAKLTKNELKVLDGLIAYESYARLPNLPWKDLVQALALHLMPPQFRGGTSLKLQYETRKLPLAFGIKPHKFRLGIVKLRYKPHKPRTMNLNLMPSQFKGDQRIDASMVEQQAHLLNLSMGDAVLAIALAHLAHSHQYSIKVCPDDSCDDLRNILEGLTPIWHRWESLYHLEPVVTEVIKNLAVPL
jgi:hypothetical protein